MEENRKKLLELMENLNFPLTGKDAEDAVVKLSDQEVMDLISIYSDMDDYETRVDDFFRENAPQEYSKILKENEESLKKKDTELLEEERQIEEKEGYDLDATYSEELKTIEEIAKDEESIAKVAENIDRGFDDIAKVAVLKTENGLGQDTPKKQ